MLAYPRAIIISNVFVILSAISWLFVSREARGFWWLWILLAGAVFYMVALRWPAIGH